MRSAKASALAYLLRGIAVVVALVVATAGVYAVNVFLGMRSAARTSGSLVAESLRAPVEIVRDARDIPHIRARNLHDLFFAQGFVEASDRLAQMDAQRHLVYGRLAEVLGAPALSIDEQVRVVDLRGMVAREWRHLPAPERELFSAFSDGINFAMRTQPVPVEFRILLYRPAPWTPQDSLAVAFATVSDLTDSWNDLISRDRDWRRYGKRGYDVLYPLSDPKYDVPLIATKRRRIVAQSAETRMLLPRERDGLGSNAWAAGAAHTTTGRALLASDPHLGVGIPGAWYLDDLRAPGFHVAGASLAGIPGVILGHNERIAWGATNGVAVAVSAFTVPSIAQLHLPRDEETFHVRFGRDVKRTYYRSSTEFAAPLPWGVQRYAIVRWPMFASDVSPIMTFLGLDRASSVREARRVLASYPGPTQNFVVADAGGDAAYQLAGRIPNDPSWGRYVHPYGDLAKSYLPLPFDRLPHVAPSRDAVVYTANNKMYGDGYPYRLSATFVSPYRAYRITQLLAGTKRYNVAYFERMQLDTFSPVDFQLAREIVAQARQQPQRIPSDVQPLVDALSTWDGHFDPHSSSEGSSVERAMRSAYDRVRYGMQINALNEGNTLIGPVDYTAVLTDALRNGGRSKDDLLRSWHEAGSVQIRHGLSRLGLHFLDGALLPGNGESDTLHVQTDGVIQSFRAVWDIGNWDAGGMVIPSGESGEPGSGHYADQTPAWISGTLIPFPFSDKSVDADTRARLTLLPAR